MLPNKIKTFVNKLLIKTRNDELKWDYNHNESCAKTKIDNFEIEIRYSFDPDTGEGQFVVDFYDQANKDFRFHSTQSEPDYDLVGCLFSEAKAINIELPEI